MLTALGNIGAEANLLLALSQSQDTGPRQTVWVSQPLLELLGAPTQHDTEDHPLIDSANRESLETLYGADSESPSTVTIRVRGQDGAVLRDRVTVQRFEMGTQTYWLTKHDITPANSMQSEPPALSGAAQIHTENLRRILRVSELGAGAIRPDMAIDELAPILVPSMANWATVVLSSPDFKTWKMGKSWHEDGPFPQVYDREVRTVTPAQMYHSDHLAVLQGRIPFALIPQVDWKYMTTQYPSETASALADLGLASLVLVPLLDGKKIIGLIVLARTAARPAFTEEDLGIARLIGDRAGRYLGRMMEAWELKQHSVRVQRALLPTFAPEPGIEVRTVYRPSAVHADVGGDWYDVHALAPDRFIISIGDVCGHDAAAAAMMAHYRATIRAFLWQQESPAGALSLLDEIISMEQDFPIIATAIVALIERSEPDEFWLSYSTAGHPPGFVVTPVGGICILNEARGNPIGLPNRDGTRPLARIGLPYGSTVVLFTDGVVEQRSTPLKERIDSVGRILEALPHGCAVSTIRDALLELNDPFRLEDDMCIVVARIDAPAVPDLNGTTQ